MPIPVPPLAPNGLVVTQAGDYSGSLTTLGSTLYFGPGTPYLLKVDELHGWYTTGAQPRGGSASLVPRPSSHGEWKTPHWYPHREVQFVLMCDIEWAGPNSWSSVVNNLLAATVTDPAGNQQFALQLDGKTTYINGTIISRDGAIEAAYAKGHLEVTVVFHAFDPRRYGNPLSGSTGPASVSGGVALPASLPAAFTGSVSPGTVTLNNPGNAEAPVVVTFAGAAQGVAVSQINTGLTLSLSSSLVIPASHSVVVDMQAESALFDGNETASRASSIVQRGWMWLQPGQNVFQYLSTAGGGTMTVASAEAWF